ncbi:MAG: TIM-barrel domain-containing protein [Solirubrobacterales bacterium]
MALTAVAPAAARTADPLRIDSGPISALVAPEPFSLRFVDGTDGDVLRTVGGGAPTPTDPRARYGPLGYSFDLRIPVVNNAFLGYYLAAEVETVWFHATRVVSSRREGNALVVIAATNDPLGHRLEVRLAAARRGAITVESRIEPGSGPLAGAATLAGGAFEASPGERFLGFGERSNAADQTGNEVFSWAEEGPFSSGAGEDLLRPLIPEFTFPTGPTATNFPIPWTVTSRGFGMLIDQTHRSTFRLASERPGAWHAEAEANRFRFTVFAGPTPARALRRYSAFAGRQPRPAPWIFGPWFQPTLESRPFELADRFRAEDVPVTVAQTYLHYLPCGAHVGVRERERERVEGYHARGYKITTYFNPHVCTSYSPVYEQAAANGFFVRNGAGEPYLLTNPFTADQIVSEIDFSHPGAAAFWQRLLDEAIDDGFDGWMEDFGEYTPTDSVFSDGRRGLEMHNRYPVLYHCASYAHTRERMGRDAAVFIRSGFHGAQPCARVVWGGDPTEDWSCSDGLCAAVHQALSVGLSGIAYWGSDIGGFHAIVNPRTDDELNARWLEFGAFSGVMRTQANGFSFGDDRAERSQVWHPAVLPIWRRYAKLRTRLLPYIEAASRDYQRRGLPLTRHLALAYPGDPAAIARQHEFLFGPDLLVAPVIEPGVRERGLYLPRGRWVDLWRSIAYGERRGSFRLKEPRLERGGREITVPAPLEQIPLLARAGTILPLLPAGVDTLAGVGRGKGLVHLRDRRRSLTLLAWPRGRSQNRFGRRGLLRSRELPGRRWELRIRDERRITYRVRASTLVLRRELNPCSVELDGRRLGRDRWRFDSRRGVLSVRLRAKRARLLVDGRC